MLVKLTLSIITCFIAFPLFSQSLFPEGQSNCGLSSFTIEDEKLLAEYSSNEAIALDFLKRFETRYMNKIRGELFVQVMIDPLGKPCCISFRNETNVLTKWLGVVNAVNSMPGWKNISGGEGNVCAIVKYKFTKKKIIATRLGYHEKKKFVPLSVTQLKRAL